MRNSGHDATLEILSPDVEGDLSACRPLPIVSTLCACARSDGAHLGNCPATGQRSPSPAPAPAPRFTSSLARLLSLAERRLADRTDSIDLMAFADAIVRRQRAEVR